MVRARLGLIELSSARMQFYRPSLLRFVDALELINNMTLTIPQGVLQATRLSHNGVEVEQFLGIPFAQPPTGSNRWKAPKTNPLPSWTTIRESKFGPDPMQTDEPFMEAMGMSGENPLGTSEDCLYLNVTRPRKAEKLPVMVWIYGGGLTTGSTTLKLYNPLKLVAEQNVIFVSINYRVNVFGFIASAELQQEEPKGVGNYGMMDIAAGLQWVKNNIYLFGGNPDDVTTFGQSAGAIMLSYLTRSQPYAGLFTKAILMSGSAEVIRPMDISFGQHMFDHFCKLFDISPSLTATEKLEALRKVPAADLLSAWSKLPFPRPRSQKTSEVTGLTGPYIDCYLILDRLSKTAGLPLVNGQKGMLYTLTDDEGTVFSMSMQTDQQVRQYLDQRFPDPKIQKTINELYFSNAEPFQAYSKMMGDSTFQTPVITAMQQSDEVPIWLLRYSLTTELSQQTLGKAFGAHHSVDNPLVFGVGKASPKEEEIGVKLRQIWADFARSGKASWGQYHNGETMQVTADGLSPVKEINANGHISEKTVKFWQDNAERTMYGTD